MGVIVRSDDEHEMMVKGNDDDGWNSDAVMHWLRMRQNEDVVEGWGEWPRLR
jgi:hypothetical protein